MASPCSKAVSCAHLGVPVRPAGPVPITAPRPARAADIRDSAPLRRDLLGARIEDINQTGAARRDLLGAQTTLANANVCANAFPNANTLATPNANRAAGGSNANTGADSVAGGSNRFSHARDGGNAIPNANV